MPDQPRYFMTAMESFREEAFRLQGAAEDIVADAERSARKAAMEFVERSRGRSVLDRVLSDYDQHIREFARDEFQARMMRAIVFEEEVHEWPPFLESTMEEIGFGDSVGPSQIRVSKWASKYQASRRDLLDRRGHFRVMQKHLEEVERQARDKGMMRTPENIGTLWNNMGATSASDYGRRVKDFDALIRNEATVRGVSEIITNERVEEVAKWWTELKESWPREIEGRAAAHARSEDQQSNAIDYGASQRAAFPGYDEPRDEGRARFIRDRFEPGAGFGFGPIQDGGPVERPEPDYHGPINPGRP